MANLIITVEGPPRSGKTQMVMDLKNLLEQNFGYKIIIGGEDSTYSGFIAVLKKFDLIITEKTI